MKGWADTWGCTPTVRNPGHRLRRCPSGGIVTPMEAAATRFLGLMFVLASCRSVPPSPISADPAPPVRRAEPAPRRPVQPRAPVTECTPAGPEICGGRCGTVPAGCGDLVVCSCDASERCLDGRCEARASTQPPPDPKPKRTKRQGKCSCCSHHGGAYISEERHRAQQSAYRQCIADGGACEGNCPVPPRARPQ